MVQATAQKIKPATAQRRVAILGSTGSVGCQTLDLIMREPEKYQVAALTANKNVAKLVEQAKALNAEMAVIADESQYAALKDALAGTNIKAAAGAKAVVEAAEADSDWVMSAIVGYAGLPGTLAAARRGAKIAFANKETLVCAGPLMMKLVAEHGAQLLPVDSEHNAIWQVFDFEHRDGNLAADFNGVGRPVPHFETRDADGESHARSRRSSIPSGAWARKFQSTARP